MLYYSICWYKGDIHKLALTYYNTEVIKLQHWAYHRVTIKSETLNNITSLLGIPL